MNARNPHGGLHDNSPEAVELISRMANTPLLGHARERVLAKELCRLRDLMTFYHKTMLGAESIEEKERYHQAFCETEDLLIQRRDEFFYANIRLVIDIVSAMSRIEFMDMFQFGAIGLMRAIDLYNPDLDVRFSTYANYWIRQAIQRGCDKDESLIALPVHIRDTLKTVRRASINYVQQFGEQPTLEQVCEYAYLDYEKIRRIKTVSELPISLESARTGESPNDTHVIDVCDDTPQAIDQILSEDNRRTVQSVIRKALTKLEQIEEYARHAQVIRLRYRIGEEVPLTDPKTDMRIPATRTLDQVGAMMISEETPDGITRERARQLQRAGFRWMLDNVQELRELREERWA